MLRLVFDRVYGPFFLGKLLSSSGMWINNVVSAIVAYQITQSALIVGLVSVAQFLPQTVLAPLSGALADRGDRRKQLIFGRVIAASGSGALAIWIFIVGVDGLPGYLPVLAAALVVGTGFMIGHPAMHSLVPALVRPSELAAAITLSSMPFTVARAAGPAIGALVAASAGPAWAFLLASAGNLAFAALLLPLKVGGRVERKPDADVSVRAGLRYVRHDKYIVMLLIGITAVSFGADPVLTLTPALASTLGQGESAVGLMASFFGVGAALAIPFVRLLQRRIGIAGAATAGLAFMVVGNVLAGLSFSLPLAVASFAVAGFGMSLAMPSFSTQLQMHVDDQFRGRVMALWIVAFQGTRPLAALLSGTLADVTTVRIALVVMGAVITSSALLFHFGRPRT